jgi:3-hydroxyacyl-CoA dehydrogenase
VRLVGEGYVSATDLDQTVRDGLGLRWSFMGPLATIELNAPGGIADYCARYSGFYRRLAEAPPEPSVWDAGSATRVATTLGPPPDARMLDTRTRWRDRRLMALAQHKRQQSDMEWTEQRKPP